jgi:hypothetical protein
MNGRINMFADLKIRKSRVESEKLLATMIGGALLGSLVSPVLGAIIGGIIGGLLSVIEVSYA